MIKRLVLYLVFILLAAGNVNSQEQISGLQTNIDIVSYLKSEGSEKSALVSEISELPFFDDFSQSSPVPDQTKWTDRLVYINNTLSVQQISSGIATLDILDQTGRLYETASTAVFEADRLTSAPINLNYPASDSLYLSFYFQPQGLADAPEQNDTLTLEFFAPAENKWYSVWRASGTGNHSFTPVNIPVKNTRYLKSGFRFRFTNYASISSNLNDPAMVGNCDQWNIDYVRLDRNRRKDDTTAPDVAFTLPLRSVLKTHESMPWNQFRQIFLSEMGPSITINYRNNDKITRNVTRNFEITDEYTELVVHSFTSGAANILPFEDRVYNAGLFYTFNNSNPDSALFRIRATLITDDFDPKNNDTTIYYQRFGDFFAFDDGSSEAGYGINGLGSRNAMVAVKYKSFIPDTLRAVQISFNDSYMNANQRSFDLVVWDDNNGVPGDIIFSQEEEIVTPGSSVNGFYTYLLNESVSVSGIFYMGWKQRTETFLNAGLDLNTQHEGRQFFWINGNWSVSQVSGSLMIRPVTGKPVEPTEVHDLPETEVSRMEIWPNPVTDILNLEIPDNVNTGELSVKIFDLYGRVLMNQKFESKTDVSSLQPGIYMIILYSGNKSSEVKRFIKTF